MRESENMARASGMILNEIQLFAEAQKEQKTEAPNFGEIGSRGEDLEVNQTTGILEETDEITIDTYRKMRKDPQVKACLLVLKLPILQTGWELQASTEEGQQLSKWCELMLTEYMEDSIEYYSREMLTALDFGRSITEKIWQLKSVPTDPDNPDSQKLEERIIPLKLKTYDPRNIKIKLDPKTLKLVGAVQTQGQKEITIPADKLLVYSHEKEFNNYNGESALRAAYKPWVIKEFLQKFWNIALERYGSPLSTMKVPNVEGSLSKAIALMDMIKTKSGIPLPEGYEMQIHNLANAGMSFKEAIEYQDIQIARAMLIPDLVFSNSGGGAYALSKTHEGFFEMRLNGIAGELADIKSKYLIRPMVRYNFGEVREYPAFKYNKVGQDDITALASIIQQMITGKVIAPTEGWIRERLGIPAPDDDAQEFLDKQREIAMAGMENIHKANQALQGKDPDDDDPKNISGKKAAKDDEGVKKAGDEASKKKQVVKNNELSDEEFDYLTGNLRDAVRGLLLMQGE
jgi:hypothetical protein